MTLEQHTGNYLLQPCRYCCLFINPWELLWWKSLWVMLIKRLRLGSLFLERRQEFNISPSWGGQGVAIGHGSILGIFRAGCSWDLGAGWVLGQWTWGWALDHPACCRIQWFPHGFLHILWTRPPQPHTVPSWASPDTNPGSPHHPNSQELLRPSLVRMFCSLGALLVLSQGRCPLPQTHPGSCTPNSWFFSYIFTLCTHWWCWFKVVVMETPFSLSANSAGFLSTASICERASFSCSPFKITAIGNIWGM